MTTRPLTDSQRAAEHLPCTCHAGDDAHITMCPSLGRPALAAAFAEVRREAAINATDSIMKIIEQHDPPVKAIRDWYFNVAKQRATATPTQGDKG